MDPIVAKYHCLSKDSKIKFVKSLPDDIVKELWKYPDLKLYKKQIIDGDDWRYYILLCGRAFGKSIASSAWLTKKILGGAKIVGVCVPVYDDLIKVMIPALQSWFPKDLKPKYNKIEHTLNYHNGAVCYCFSSDKEVRGVNLEYLACDEVCVWSDGIEEKIEERFKVLDLCVRVGKTPQTVVTTTPKPMQIFRNWQKLAINQPDLYKLVNGSMLENPFLPQSYKDAVFKQYEGTKFFQQEVFGCIISDVEGALWSRDLIDKQTLPKNTDVQFKRIVVAIDPAVTADAKSDETGIVVAALGVDGKCYILGDASGKYEPLDWSKKAIELYDKYKADRIVAEKNNGGSLVEINLRTVSKNAAIKLVHASKGKIARAEPVQALYAQNRVYHIGSFAKLEDQMCSYTGDTREKSPDRMDALVWAVTELLLEKTTTNRSFNPVGYF